MLGDDDAESVVTRLISPALEQEREARKVEDRKLLALLAHFDEEQLNRFETFRRATFAKASVRRVSVLYMFSSGLLGSMGSPCVSFGTALSFF